ncbi:MAG: hypothetical protein QNJ22_19345 [Desulfosarcinaceae bacterium]|nr:hypothetical protein [Desulfosarcinaceae bacterium]
MKLVRAVPRRPKRRLAMAVEARVPLFSRGHQPVQGHMGHALSFGADAVVVAGAPFVGSADQKSLPIDALVDPPHIGGVAVAAAVTHFVGAKDTAFRQC